MHPILYEIPTPWGRIAIFSYGACLSLAALIGWYVYARHDRESAAHFVFAWICALVVGKVDWTVSYGGAMFEGGLTLSGLVAGAVFATWIRGAATKATPILMLTVALHALGQWLHSAEPTTLYELFGALLLAFAAHRQPSRAWLWTAAMMAMHAALEPLRNNVTIAYALPAAAIGALALSQRTGGFGQTLSPEDERQEVEGS